MFDVFIQERGDPSRTEELSNSEWPAKFFVLSYAVLLIPVRFFLRGEITGGAQLSLVLSSHGFQNFVTVCLCFAANVTCFSFQVQSDEICGVDSHAATIFVEGWLSCCQLCSKPLLLSASGQTMDSIVTISLWSGLPPILRQSCLRSCPQLLYAAKDLTLYNFNDWLWYNMVGVWNCASASSGLFEQTVEAQFGKSERISLGDGADG